jgi:hypothetical protein
MLELSVRFTSDEKDETSPIGVSLSRPDTGTATNPVPFAPPLDDANLADLRWYLEVFSGWPTGPDYKRAERIEAGLEDWGRALLKSVIGGDDAPRLWQQFVDAEGDGKLVTIDATDPRVLRLPWELLADKEGHVFSQGIGIRRRLQKATGAPLKPLALPVRVLVVVSRPEGAGFIDPRAVSRPLLDALDELGERVEVEFLYPPTLKALTNRLRDRQAPPVHVVHFDGHGVYDATLGLGYLLFENEAHQADRVDANRLGTLLNRCGVPLMVLNACQSAQQEETNPYASVAARLIRAGVGSVLAMNYSVLVVAARKFVAAFYGGLADGLTVGQAADAGRFELHADEQRHTLTRRDQAGRLVEETIHLRDWFLPALYQQAADPIVFSPPPLPPREGLGGRSPPCPDRPQRPRRAARRAAARLPRPRPRAAPPGARPGRQGGGGAARLRRHGQDGAGRRGRALVPPHRALPRRRRLRLLRARRLARPALLLGGPGGRRRPEFRHRRGRPGRARGQPAARAPGAGHPGQLRIGPRPRPAHAARRAQGGARRRLVLGSPSPVRRERAGGEGGGGPTPHHHPRHDLQRRPLRPLPPVRSRRAGRAGAVRRARPGGGPCWTTTASTARGSTARSWPT